MKDIAADIARLSNYERVLKETITFTRKELYNISVINRFLNIIKDRKFTVVSFDEFLRREVKIDPRRFWRLLNSNVLLTEKELIDLNCFILMNSDS